MSAKAIATQMKVTCRPSVLGQALQVVSRAISSRTTLPILNNILIETTADELALTATNPASFALVDRYFSYEPYALMLRRGDPDFRIAVNRSLARLYRSGDIIVIYRRWLGALGAPNALELATWAIEGLPE